MYISSLNTYLMYYFLCTTRI